MILAFSPRFSSPFYIISSYMKAMAFIVCRVNLYFPNEVLSKKKKIVLFPSVVPLSFPSPPAHSPLWFKTHTTILLFYCKITQSVDWDTFRSPPASHLLHIWKWCAAPSNWKSICLKLCLWHLAQFIKNPGNGINFIASLFISPTFRQQCTQGLARLSDVGVLFQSRSGCGPQ